MGQCLGRGMVEVWAAVAGASITVAGVGVTGLNRQGQQGRDSLVRLTTAKTLKCSLALATWSVLWQDWKATVIDTRLFVVTGV
jgi:hypothetical protein